MSGSCVSLDANSDYEDVVISFPSPVLDGAVWTYRLDRAEARLLARRINECLKATAKR